MQTADSYRKCWRLCVVAFFFVGARALPVSRWAVPSEPTVKLMTSTLRRAAPDKKIGPPGPCDSRCWRALGLFANWSTVSATAGPPSSTDHRCRNRVTGKECQVLAHAPQQIDVCGLLMGYTRRSA